MLPDTLMAINKINSRAPVATPIIPATQEAETRRIVVQSQPCANIVPQDPISKKKPFTKEGLVWLKVKALSSNPRSTKKKKKD
jgi:hypothetical protein